MGSPTHLHSNTPTYESWQGMKQRCTNPKHARAKYYKGVSYDPRWEDFQEFFRDMGERPEGTTLDRHPDRTGNYTKDNCRWATPQQQAINRRSTNKLKWVYWLKNRKNPQWSHWVVKITINKERQLLYSGYDLFEAACVSKSYEAHCED